LKNAGFPQEGRGKRLPPPDKIGARRHDYAYVPALEELIEALGSELGVIVRKHEREWYADSEPGSSATEAVACLWLTLNSK